MFGLKLGMTAWVSFLIRESQIVFLPNEKICVAQPLLVCKARHGWEKK